MTARATHVQDRLLELTYGELSPDESRLVEAHVDECPSCREALEEIRGVRRVMSKLSQPAAPEGGLESLFAYAQQSARRASAGPPPKSTWWRKWLVPAGGLAAAVTFGIIAHEVAQAPELQNPREQVMLEKLAATAQEARAPQAPPMEMAERSAEPVDDGVTLGVIGPVAEERAGIDQDLGLRGSGKGSGSGEHLEIAAAAGPPKEKVDLNRRQSPSRQGAKKRAPAAEEEARYADKAMLGGSKDALAVRRGWNSEGGAAAMPSRDAQPSFAEEGSVVAQSSTGAGRAGLSQPSVAPPQAPVAAPPTSSPRKKADAETAPSVAAPAPTSAAPEARAERKAAAKMAPPVAAAAPPSAAPEANSGKRAAAPSAAPESAQRGMARSEIAHESMDLGYDRAQSRSDAARAQAQALSEKAYAAQRDGSRQLEARYLKEALATGVADAGTVTNLLLRLCDAHFAVGNATEGEAACERVVREFPSSSAARVASRRLVESRARRGEGEAASEPATGATPAETPR